MRKVRKIALAPSPPKPKKPRTLLTLDLHDEIDPTTREWVVYEADGTVRASTEEEVRAEKLGIRFEVFLAGLTLTAEQERLVQQIGEQIRKNASDMTEFELWRLSRPPFALQGGVQRAMTIFAGAEALEAFLASLNHAVYQQDSRCDQAGEHGATTGSSFL